VNEKNEIIHNLVNQGQIERKILSN